MRYGPFRPSRNAIIEYFFLQNAYIAQFLIIYGFTNQRASQSESLFHLYWDFELAIPFIPEMFIVYYSINILILVLVVTIRISTRARPSVTSQMRLVRG